MADTDSGPWNDYAAPAAASNDGPWNDFTPPKVSTVEDVGKGAVTGAAKGAGNLVAATVAPEAAGIYNGVKYGAPAAEKYLGYVDKHIGEGVDAAGRALTGQPQLSDAERTQEQKEISDAEDQMWKEHPVMSAINDPIGALSRAAQKLPSAGDLVEKGAAAIGHPLPQPQTEAGKAAEQALEYAGLGGKSNLGTAAAASAGMTGAQEAAKKAGLGQEGQDWAALAGGAGAGKMASSPMGETPMSANEDQAASAIFGKNASAKNPEGLGSEDLRKMAKPGYDYVQNAGANLSPDFVNEAVKNFRDNINESERVTRAFGETAPQRVVNGIEQEYAGTPMSLVDATDIVKRLNREINTQVDTKSGKLSPDGQQLYAMKADFVDQLMGAADKGQVTGDPNALPAWRTSTDLWARAMRSGEIERIIDRSSQMDNPDTSLRLGLRNLYNNKKLFNRYTPEEQEYIQKASATGVGGELLRAAGSRLATQGLLAMGNIPAAVGNVVMSKGWRNIAFNARRGQAQKIIDQIVDGAQAYKPPEMGQGRTPIAGLLTDQSQNFQVDRDGVAVQSPRVAPFEFGSEEGMPYQSGERDQVRAQNGAYQNMPMTKPIAQKAFNNAMGNDPEAAQAQQTLQNIATTGSAQPPKALPAPQQGNEMISGPQGIRPSTQSEDWANAQQRQQNANMGLTPDVRAAQQQNARPSINANLSAATGSIPVLENLVKAANNGDAGAHQMLNKVAQDSLERLVGGIPSARVDVTPGSGLYGGSLEPSLGARVLFNEEDRPAVLAALAKFADNFNQEQIHVRNQLPEGTEPGQQFDDGSFATPVHRLNLKTPMSRAQIEKIADEAGLAGFTANPKALETYYVGDPNDAAAIKQFEDGVEKAQKLIGPSLGSHSRSVEQLWSYGSEAQPYTGISGNFRAPQETTTDIPRLIGERNTGAPVKPAQQQNITGAQKARQQAIARTYDQLPVDDLKNPLVEKAYSELADEVKKQFQSLPIKVDVWNGNGEPYSNSAAMRNDVANNNHLWIYKTTPETFGPPGHDFADHPLLKDSGLKSQNGEPLLVNDLLRAVHDYFAHNISPTDFGPKGEEAAWKNHMASTKSPWARWALTSETRGQNSWVNFNPQGEGKSLTERPFAVQKAALLPINYTMTGDGALDAPMKDLAQGLTSKQKRGSEPPKRASGGRIDPTEAQKHAGNYQKEHIAVHGLPISIETPAGAHRSGKSADGKWKVKMPCDYGYFKGTKGADGDHVDCFVGPHKKSANVYVINQIDHKTGKFDEHKVMLGFASEKQAKSYYERSFSDGHGAKRMKNITQISIGQLKHWLRNGNMKQPFKGVKHG